jgi:hypothetical protein
MMADDSKRLSWVLTAVTVVLVAVYVAMRFLAPGYFDRPQAVEQAATGERAEAPTPEPTRPAAPHTLDAQARQARAENEQTVTIETDRYVATFTDRNTALVSFRLKGDRFTTESGEGLEMVTTDRGSTSRSASSSRA